MTRSLARILTFSSLVALLACGGDSTGPGHPPKGAQFLFDGIRYVIVSPGNQITIRPALYDSAGQVLSYSSPTVFQWTSSAPNQASVSDAGVVKVAAGATIGTHVVIHVCLESLCRLPEIIIGPAPDSITLVTQGKFVVPGGRSSLTGIAWVGGNAQAPYFYNFGVSDSSVLRVQPHACGEVPRCVADSPDVTESYPLTNGTVTVTAHSQGKTATGTMTVRNVQFTPTTISAGGSHTCAATTDGVLFCWGDGFARTPIGPAGPDQLQQVQAGAGQTCGIDMAGLIQCWKNAYNPIAAPVSTTIHFTHLAVGAQSSCGIDTNGNSWCWGDNSWGQLGDGSRTSSTTPVQVSGGHPFVQLAAYGDHTCGRTAAGDAWCWGSNFINELGSPGMAMACGVYDCALVPAAVTGSHKFVSIVAGSYHNCGIDIAGAAWCWGALDKAGNGAIAPPNPTDPVAVSGGHVWTQLSAGSDHTCGITNGGQSLCWGANPDGRSGQIPNGGTLVVPTVIAGGHSFSVIEAGGGHTCGYASDGVYCFGDNGYGQVGATTVNTQSAVKVAGQD